MLYEVTALFIHYSFFFFFLSNCISSDHLKHTELQYIQEQEEKLRDKIKTIQYADGEKEAAQSLINER